MKKGWVIRGTALLLCSVVLLAAGCSGGSKQTAKQDVKYPTKPIEVLVGYGAGGASDITARIVAPFLEKHLGQPVVTVNSRVAAAKLHIAGWRKQLLMGIYWVMLMLRLRCRFRLIAR